jgi:membrane protein DedA with SNARE-associated domain
VALAICAVSASIAGDCLDYCVGRRGSSRLLHYSQRRLARHPRAAAVLGRLGAPREQALLVFLSRFAITPIATPASLAAGASGLGFAAFLLWDAAGEGIFVASNLALGRMFSAGGVFGWPLVAVCAVVALAGWALTGMVGSWHGAARRQPGLWQKHRSHASRTPGVRRPAA